MGIGFHSKEDHPDLFGPTAELVRDCIFNSGVVMFSKTYCPYCKMAKEVLDSIGCQYEVIELDKREDGDKIQYILGLMTGARTVPRIFIDGKFIGGGNDLKKLYESGTLRAMIENISDEIEDPESMGITPSSPGDSDEDCCCEEATARRAQAAAKRAGRSYKKELLATEKKNKQRETGAGPQENRGGEKDGRTGEASGAPPRMNLDDVERW